MSKTPHSNRNTSQPRVYQIRMEGHLDPQWTDWFEGLTITLEDNGDTLLTGPVADQSALHGLLKRVRDLGIPLVSVSLVAPESSTAPGTDQTDVSDTGTPGSLFTPKSFE